VITTTCQWDICQPLVNWTSSTSTNFPHIWNPSVREQSVRINLHNSIMSSIMIWYY